MFNPAYRVVQRNLTPEMEVSCMLFERFLSIFSVTTLKQHMEYFNFRCKIQLDLPVHSRKSLQLNGSYQYCSMASSAASLLRLTISSSSMHV